MAQRIYRNEREVANLHGVPIYMNDVVDACLAGKLNIFIQGDTGSGKTQLAADAMSSFGAGTGDGRMASAVAEQYKDRLDAKGLVAVTAAQKMPEDKTLFVLGRNDMDTRELFQRFNLHRVGFKPHYDLEPLVDPETGNVRWYYPKVDDKGVFAYSEIPADKAAMVRSRLETLAGSTENIRELTSKINTNLIVVDELPNCVPAVRAQLFNLFDGFVELNGKHYAIGSNGYSVGIATGNIGQQFTESSNDLGRAIKDRMHVIIDADHFFPKPSDTLEILAGNTDPRVDFGASGSNEEDKVIERYKALSAKPVPLSKLIVANYLLHGLDYCKAGNDVQSKRQMKNTWPNAVDSHGQGSDESLVLPLSTRAAKSVIRLSQALDDFTVERGVPRADVEKSALNSMMQAYRLVAPHSGVLNEAKVQGVYNGDHYKAINAVITTTITEFNNNKDNLKAGLEMVRSGKTNKKITDLFKGRWGFMKDTLDRLMVHREGAE